LLEKEPKGRGKKGGGGEKKRGGKRKGFTSFPKRNGPQRFYPYSARSKPDAIKGGGKKGEEEEEKRKESRRKSTIKYSPSHLLVRFLLVL